MRRVCFLGTAAVGIEQEQLVDEIPEDAELWVVNEAHHRLGDRKPSRVFQLHVRDWRELERRYLASGSEDIGLTNGTRYRWRFTGMMPPLPVGLNANCFGRNDEHVEYLRTCGVPVYGQRVWDDIPTSIRYPFEEVRDAVGITLPPHGHKRLWATSSFGYMAALLLTEHVNAHGLPSSQPMTRMADGDLWQGHTFTIDYPDRIQELLLYGIELPLGTSRERLWEWPNLAYYLGLATGHGIKITLPSCGSSLLSAPHYALDGRPKPYDPDHWHFPVYPGVEFDADHELYRLGRYVAPELAPTSKEEV